MIVRSSKKKRQKGGNENTEPRPLVCNLFLFLFFSFTLLPRFILIVSSIYSSSVMGAHFLFFFFLFLRIRESELLSLFILDFHSC